MTIRARVQIRFSRQQISHIIQLQLRPRILRPRQHQIFLAYDPRDKLSYVDLLAPIEFQLTVLRLFPDDQIDLDHTLLMHEVEHFPTANSIEHRIS